MLVATTVVGAPIGLEGRVPRLGVVTGGRRSRGPLLAGLRDLGYVPGQTIEITEFATEGRPELYRPLIERVLKSKPDVLLVSSTHGLKAATALTTTIPIVVVDLETDPVTSGFAATLARPGRNVSGLFLDVPEMSAKMLQLLKEAVPVATRVVVVWDAAISRAQFEAVERAAQATGIALRSAPVRLIDDVDPALDSATRDGARALVILSSPVFRLHQARLDDAALRYRLPSVTAFDLLSDGNGFLSYGPDVDDMFRRSASYVDRVLKGVPIGELPIERPAKFYLRVNVRTARALGLAIPQSLLLRADQVIQ